MNTRYTTVNLDVSQQGSIPSITLSQYDLGVGLSFYIMDGGLPYSEFAETDTVVLSGTKPSGVGFTVPAYYKSGNLCSFRTPQAMTTEAGTVTCEITITKVNNISVSTANFFVEVEASAHAHETVDEDIEDFSLIANQVGEYKAVAVRAAQQAAQSATDAAASAGSAEESMEAAQSAASSAIAAKDDIQEYIDDSEAWARGTRGGTAVSSTDETYENNAKYYAEQSSQASIDAGVSATEAAASAQEAAASVVGAVKYTAQSLTTEQKAQARTNIGAASPSDIPSGTVRYDTSQSLTDAQKTQAKSNIGVPAVDATLAVTGAAADAKKVGDEIADLKGDLENIEPLSDEVKEALLACFQNVVWKDGNSQSYYSALERALNGDVPILTLFKNGLGLSGNSSPFIVSIIDNTQRGIVYSESGDRPLINDSSTEISVYPIKIPEGATGVRFHGMQETDYVSINFWILSYTDNNWKFRNGAGFGKIIPDIVQRPEIANHNDGSYYMIGIYGIADATHTNPLYNKDCDIDVTDFEMEIIEKNTILFAKGYSITVPNPVTVITNSERMLGYTNTGEYEVTRASGDLTTKVYPISIPAGAKGIKFYGMEETDYITVNVQIVKYEDGVWKQKAAAGFEKIIPDTLSRTEIATYAGSSDYFMMYIFGIADATHVNPVQGKTFNNYDITNFRAEVVV